MLSAVIVVIIVWFVSVLSVTVFAAREETVGLNLGLSPNLRPNLTSRRRFGLRPDLSPNFGLSLKAETGLSSTFGLRLKS